jgi:crotonobetainyl-CoA:carnitine CoA-transferase CaiB-like acyl-CoA transferase
VYDLLDGIRVIDFSTWLFGPTAGAVLADWGADVIKVEDATAPDPARGLVVGGVQTAGVAPMVEFANRGKRSIALDIGHEQGRELLHRLVASADVFITNMRTRATERLGVDVASLRAVNPRLVCVRATGYGQRGPDADRPAFDVAATWASGGAAFQATRPDGRVPAVQPGSVGDITGGLSAAGAVAAALLKRSRTGEPSVIDVALQSVGMWLMGYHVTMAAAGALPAPHRYEGPPNPLVNAFRTRDGCWLYFAIMQADRFWASLCAHLGRPELVEDPRFADSRARMQNTDELTALLQRLFGEQTLAEWEARLAGFDGVWAPALSPADLRDHPQVRANGFLVDVDHPSGPLPLTASPAQFDEHPLAGVGPAPQHGQHTDEVLLELGLTMEEILAAKIDGAVL